MGNLRSADRLPVVRVVRQGAEPPPGWRTRALRSRAEALFEPLLPGLRTTAAYVVGLFPLIATVALAVAFLWIAGLRGSP